MLKVVCRDKHAVLKFKTTCVNFLEELIDQIQSRFGSSLFKQLEFIQPANLLKMNSPTLAAVMQTYRKLIKSCYVSLVDLQWKQLWLKGEHSNIKDTTLFWKASDGTGTPAYPNLTKLIGAALSLPHSNAAVERIFN